jgi:hypothetical protein
MIGETALITTGGLAGAYVLYSVATKNSPLQENKEWLGDMKKGAQKYETIHKPIADMQKVVNESNDNYEKSLMVAPAPKALDNGSVPPRTVINVPSKGVPSTPRIDASSRKVSSQSNRATSSSNRPTAHPQPVKTVPINLASQTWNLHLADGTVQTVGIDEAANMGNPLSKAFPRPMKGRAGPPAGSQWLTWSDRIIWVKRNHSKIVGTDASNHLGAPGITALNEWRLNHPTPYPAWMGRKDGWDSGPSESLVRKCQNVQSLGPTVVRECKRTNAWNNFQDKYFCKSPNPSNPKCLAQKRQIAAAAAAKAARKRASRKFLWGRGFVEWDEDLKKYVRA